MTNDLLKALETIKNECKSHKHSCEGCPLLNRYGECGVIHGEPHNWDLTKKEYYL